MPARKGRYWSGGLKAGAVVFHNGKRCRVAGENELAEFVLPVPDGCVPIFYCDAVEYGVGPTYAVPLDDLDVES